MKMTNAFDCEASVRRYSDTWNIPICHSLIADTIRLISVNHAYVVIYFVLLVAGILLSISIYLVTLNRAKRYEINSCSINLLQNLFLF